MSSKSLAKKQSVELETFSKTFSTMNMCTVERWGVLGYISPKTKRFPEFWFGKYGEVVQPEFRHKYRASNEKKQYYLDFVRSLVTNLCSANPVGVKLLCGAV